MQYKERSMWGVKNKNIHKKYVQDVTKILLAPARRVMF